MSRSSNYRKGRGTSRNKFHVMGDHEEFLSRINKRLYYGKLPSTERFSLPVSELAAELFSEAKYSYSLDRLRVEEVASMSRNACVSPCSLVLALVYLERLKISNAEYLRQVPPSELFLVSMMVASKFLHDHGEDDVYNDEWAASAGITVQEMNHYERDFLKAMDWEVFVKDETFWSKLRELERDVAFREGKKRGWFSYTDLDRLLELFNICAFTQTVLTVSAVCLTSYTASVLALVGSAFFVSQIPGTAITPASPEVTNVYPIPYLETAATDFGKLSVLEPHDALVNYFNTEEKCSGATIRGECSCGFCDMASLNQYLKSNKTQWHSELVLPAIVHNRTNSDSLQYILKWALSYFDYIVDIWPQQISKREHTNWLEREVNQSTQEWGVLVTTWLLEAPTHTTHFLPMDTVMSH